MSVSLNGFEALDNLKQVGRSNSFSKLNALKTLSIKPTPPDNRANVRFLYDGFAMIKVHNWVKIGERFENILCEKNNSPKSHCILCEEGINVSNRGISIVALLDNRENPLFEEINDASVEHLSDYMQVMDKKNIIQDGDNLILNNVPQVRILNMSADFWRSMKSFREKYETICDRSYTIFRNGAKLDTKYTVAPSDKDMEYKNPELLQMNFEPGLDFCISVEDYIKFLSRDSLYEGFKKNYVDSSPATQNDSSGSQGGSLDLHSMINKD